MISKRQKTFCSRPLHERELIDLSELVYDEILVPGDEGRRILLTIQERLKDLAPMGDDDRRSLWIEMLSDGADEVVWYELVSGCFRDCHYLVLSDPVFISVAIAVGGELEYEGIDSDELTDFLSGLNDYVSRLVGRIQTSPEVYNDYVEANLPFTEEDVMIVPVAPNPFRL